jgi:hypothetical protein
MAVIIDSKCKKCGGTITSDGGNPTCINCGWSSLENPGPAVLKEVKIVAVVEKRPEDNKLQRPWFRKHKAEIREDIIRLGASDAAKKWGYPYQMAGAFLKPEKGRKTPAAADRQNTPRLGDLPGLPAFVDGWAPEVQIKWLEVWQSSRRRA